MTVNIRFKSCLLSLLFLVSIPIPAKAQADLITYQGKLTNSAGVALPDGIYRVGFRIWDVATGGTAPLWSRKYDVPVTTGLFSIMMGAPGLPWATPAPLTESLKLALSSGSRFVEITVMSDAGGPEKPANQLQVLTPRQQLGSVPSAINGVPPGTVVAFAGPIVPDGWLLCNGNDFPQADPRYKPLFDALGTTYNVPADQGSPKFRIPDYRGMFLRGMDEGTNRDPDTASRVGMFTGAVVGSVLGSYQRGATAEPNTPFMVKGINDSTSGGNSLLMKARTNVGTRADFDGLQGGGDRETRPINIYVKYIIKL